MIARDIQTAGAGLRSIAEPVVDTTSDFAELVLAMLGVAAKLERRRIIERTARGRADAKEKGVKFGRKQTSPPISSRKRANGSRPARHNAASRAATMSVRRRLPGLRLDFACAWSWALLRGCKPPSGRGDQPRLNAIVPPKR